MASQGPRSPTASTTDNGSGGTVAWTNVDGSWSSDNGYAQSILGGNATSYYLKDTGYGFTVPSGATVTGIKAEIERKRGDLGTLQDHRVRLIKGGTVGSDDKADVVNWPTSDTVKSYGGDGDMWATTWTVAEVNSSAFGVALSVYEVGGLNTAYAWVDHIKVTVYYTAPATPVNVTPAVISGSAAVEQTLTLTDGSGPEDWTGEVSIAQKWQRADNAAFTTNVADIASATGSTYVLAAADTNKYVRCLVTATNTGGDTSSASNTIGPVTALPAPPVNVNAAAIAGTPAQAGVTLTLTEGDGGEDWTGETTIVRQWQRSTSATFASGGGGGATYGDATYANATYGGGAAASGITDIAGQTGATYVLAAADAAQYVRCRVRATNAQGTTDSNSNILGAVTNPATPTRTVAPVATVVGTVDLIPGSLVSTTIGTWANSPLSYSYQWQRSLTIDTGGGGGGGATYGDATYANATYGGATGGGGGGVAYGAGAYGAGPYGGTVASSWVNVGGATLPAYVVQTADVAFYLRCQVSATNASGTG